MWHNTDQVEQAVDENLVVLRWVIHNVKGWHYEDVRRTAFEGGFVQQHMGKGVAPSGLAFAMPACIVGRSRAAGSLASRSTSTRPGSQP